MDDDLRDLDPVGLLAAAGEAVRARRLAEVRDLEVLLQWAAAHSDDPTLGPRGALARHWGNRLVRLGGEGTPGVQDFCLGEIALARGTGVTATTNALADVLDLVHRLPLTWAVCRAGEAEVFIARRVAKLSRHLPVSCVGVVDAAVARVIGHEAGGRTLAVAEGAVVAADPALHDERVEAERRRRYVGLSRTDEYGLRTVIARVAAGEAVWIEAMVTRVAEILTPRHPDASPDEVRAIAFGWLARPAELLQLLLQAQQAETAPETEAEAAADPDPAFEDDLGGLFDPEEPDEPADEPDEEFEEPGDQSRATAFPADLLQALAGIDLTRLAPKVVLYVHLHEAAIASRHGVARVEGLGPITLTQLQTLLARTKLTIKPVIDLAGRTRSTAYEHPEWLKEQVHLATGGDYWPYATSTSRGVDFDHPTPFDPDQDIRGGPPGQTGPHNSGPLGRRHHRWKTHAGFRSRQCGEGRYVWITPHGLAFLVDHRGTRRIEPAHAEMIYDAPPGVDIYPH